MRILPLRGNPAREIDFSRPKVHLSLGGKGSGKSSFLECCALRYPRTIDIFGSRDNEGLAWLRSEFHSANEILLMTGSSVEVNGKWDAHTIRELSFSDIERYRIVISVSALFSSLDEEFSNLNTLIYQKLYTRRSWNTLTSILLREASNFLYSRVRITRNQTIAKADFLYLMRENRHMGFPSLIDTIRWTSIDKEIRDTTDLLIIKSVGIMGLPRDLRFVYRYVDPYALMNPHPATFIMIGRKGSIGLGRFELPPFHKKEDEDLLETFGLHPEYGEIPITGDEDRRNVVGDFEHNEIISKRIEGLTYRKMKETIHRSVDTLHRHIIEHDDGIRSHGYCIKCRRIKSPFASRIVEIEK